MWYIWIGLNLQCKKMSLNPKSIHYGYQRHPTEYFEISENFESSNLGKFQKRFVGILLYYYIGLYANVSLYKFGYKTKVMSQKIDFTPLRGWDRVEIIFMMWGYGQNKIFKCQNVCNRTVNSYEIFCNNIFNNEKKMTH